MTKLLLMTKSTVYMTYIQWLKWEKNVQYKMYKIVSCSIHVCPPHDTIEKKVDVVI